jgi:hypothetical protein
VACCENAAGFNHVSHYVVIYFLMLSRLYKYLGVT